MKKMILFKLLLTATIVNSQTIVQPISSGDYWQIDEYKNRLPELANKTTFPVTIKFTDGYIGIDGFSVNKLISSNELTWNIGAVENVKDFVIEWSRDLKTFQQAGIVHLTRTDGGTHYTYRHSFDNGPLVYYRVGIITTANKITCTPAVQLMDEEHSTKVFPTIIKGSTFYIQTAKAFEKLQVINSSNQAVYEKGINGQTGTITVGLPSLPKGIYFVRLLASNQQQQVEKILVE